MAVELQQNQFQILDKMDEQQIIAADKALKEVLVYSMKINNKPVKQLTFLGLKWITVKMAQKNQALEIVSSTVKLDKDDPDNREFWFWRAVVRTRNQKTGLETEGVAECPYYSKAKDESLSYDQFGRTKAHSKAERNSWRKQIPEAEILQLIGTASGEQIQEVDGPKQSTPSGSCSCEFEETQVTPDKKGCSNCHKILSPAKIAALEKRGMM